MTDKEKIRAEVERLNHLVPYDRKDRHDDGLHDAYFKILQFIDSLEEPVSKELKEAAENCYYHNHAYATESFIEGANWQKEQMMKNAVDGEVTLDYWDSEDREVDLILADNVIGEEHGIKDGDKVKLIIIKEAEK